MWHDTTLVILRKLSHDTFFVIELHGSDVGLLWVWHFCDDGGCKMIGAASGNLIADQVNR